MDKQQIKERINALRKEINEANKAYFLENHEIIPEEIRDSLKRELINLEKENPEFITSDSPTQRIWAPLEGFLPKIKHSKRKESLSDVFSFEEIDEWIERISKDLPWWKDAIFESGFVCELKIDGLNITLTYQDWELKKAATRWDWEIWEDITNNAKAIYEIPIEVESWNKAYNESSNLGPNFEIWGEVFMTKKAFENTKKNEKIEFKNPRNCAAWTLRQLDPKLVEKRHLNFFAYNFSKTCKTSNLKKPDWLDLPETRFTQNQNLQNLKSLKFPVEDHYFFTKNLEDIKNFCTKWREKRNSLPYEIDWVVIKINDLKIQERLGSTAKSPRWAVAYKFPATLAQSQLLDVTFQVWRTWVITPVANLSPVLLEGSTVSRATLHNFDEIERLDVRIWDTVIIEKAWDIIPKVRQVIKEMRPENTKKIEIPKNCPVCESEVKRIEWEVAYRCLNPKCWVRHLRSLSHFTSRDWLNIDGFWEKIVEALIDAKIIEDFWDIFSLKFWDFYFLPLFKEKKARNLLDSIEKAKNPLLSKFLFALWIPFIGQETAEIIAKYISKNCEFEEVEIKKDENEQMNLFDIFSDQNDEKNSWSIDLFSNWEGNQGISKITKISNISETIEKNKEKIENLEWIWEKVAKSLFDYFENKQNQKVLKKLEENWLKPELEKIEKEIEQIFEGKTFVLTWALANYSREKAKELIKERWWKVSSSVSKKTDYVLAWNEAWDKLETANRLWVKVLDEEDFRWMI